MIRKHLLPLFILALLPLLLVSYDVQADQSPAGVTSDKQAIPAQYLTAAQDGEPLDIALNYVQQNLVGSQMKSADFSDYLITDQYTSQRSGTTHIYLRQRVDGIEVTTARMNTNIAADGSVMNLYSTFIADAAQATNTKTPTLSAVDAVSQAATALELNLSEPLNVLATSRATNQVTIISDGGISRNDIPAKLMYHPTASGELRLVWEMEIFEREAQHYWVMRVDATTGDVLDSEDLVIHEDFDAQAAEAHGHALPTARHTAAPAPSAFDKFGQPMLFMDAAPTAADAQPTSYQVYPLPQIDPADAPDREQTIVTSPQDAAPIASPKGWHDITGVDEDDMPAPVTQGNNVLAYLDAAAGGAGAPTPATDPTNFEFHHDIVLLDGPPAAYANASVTNLFYWNNINHDIHYQYGFDEVSGNLQFNTYGRGGAGNDLVLAQAQDSGGTNNANMLTLADGIPAQMQMYLGVNPGGEGLLRDGSLDNPVIIHEYGHSVSIRLTGGPATSCLSGDEQGGEGWSDWWGLVFTHKPGDVGSTPRPIGNWLFGQGPDGAGIRQRPYTTDFAVNEQTYDSIKGGVSAPHGVGSIWATIIWDVYWELVDEYGFNPDLYDSDAMEGNIIALNIVSEGLKLQPCSPTFINQRDGILLAEQSLYDGKNQCLIWEAFARRGLGFSAKDGGSTSRTDGTEAFDMPPACAAPSAIIGITPPVQSACVPDSADYNILVSPTEGFTGNVALSLTDAPAGYSAAFSPATIAAPGNSTLTLSNSGTATAGSYTFEVVGTAGSTQRSTATLNLFTAAPSVAGLEMPANGAIGVAEKPAFSWAEVPQTDKYRVEVATDSAFANVVYMNETAETSDVPGGTFVFDKATTYYWRVTTLNSCGNAVSDTFAFETQRSASLAPVCTQPPPPNNLIPEGGVLSFVDEVTVNATGPLADLQLSLDVSHTYIGDLTFTLEHVDTGTSVVLLRRPGNNACSENDIDATFSDAGEESADDQCSPAGPAIFDVVKPTEPLSAFNGEDASGDWQLTATDAVVQDVGFVNEWCVIPSTAAAADYSDAPSGYGVALHAGGGALRLGDEWTADNSFAAGNDDASDDGIAITQDDAARAPAQVTATVNGTLSGANGWLQGWFDWDKSGTFDANELVVNGSVTVGANDFNIDTMGSGDVQFRFRLFDSETEPAVGATDSAENGEVEDGTLTISGTPPTAVSLNNLDGATQAAWWLPALGLLVMLTLVVAHRRRNTLG